MSTTDPSAEIVFVPDSFVPTDEQVTIQRSRDKFVIVEAHAGTAKTTTLALRIGQALARGAPPSSLVVLTYTEPAVTAMRQALKKVGVEPGLRTQIRVCTFEQFAAQALKDCEGCEVPVLDTAEQLKPHLLMAIDQVLDSPDERFADEILIPGSGDAVVESYLSDFARLKGTLQLLIEADGCQLTPALARDLGLDYGMLRVFDAYERERRGGNLDHPRFRAPGDATYDLARRLLSEFERDLILPVLRRQPVYLLCLDEMHDTNRAMFSVLRGVLAANPRTAFIGVGDRDQVLHELAGADAQFMSETFDREIGYAKRYPLSASYRFGAGLAKAAGKLASKTYRSRAPHKTRIEARGFADRQLACAFIAQAALAREGLQPKAPMSEFAVLLRHGHQSIGIENQLLAQGIAYETRGFQSYLRRPEVLLVRALLAYASEDYTAIENPQTRREAARALLTFGGGVLEVGGRERDEQHALTHEALQAVEENPRLLIPFFENQVLRNGTPLACRHMQAAVAVAREAPGPDLLRRFIQALDPQQLAARALVKSAHVRQVAANMNALMACASGHEHPRDFCAALNTFEQLRAGSGRTQPVAALVLSSIEAAKGLEFQHVVMPFLNPREFVVSENPIDDRNLFYVGITRARHQLTLTWDASRPSQLLVDAGITPLNPPGASDLLAPNRDQATVAIHR